MLMVLVTRMNFIVIPCVSARWDFGRIAPVMTVPALGL